MADIKLESKVLSEINLDQKSLQDGVKHLIDWIYKQPHLPNTTDEDLLKAFIVGSKSVQGAKERLDKYYTTKTKHPVAFSVESRDPKNIKWNGVERMARLPGLTPEGYSVCLFQMPLTKEETENFSFIETCKVFFIMLDLMFKTQPLTSGQLIFIDSQGLSMELMTKFLSSFISVTFDFYQRALPVRMKALVVYNSSSIADIFCNKVLKPFLSEKLSQRVFMHSEDHSILTKWCPPEMIPQDLGGKAPTFEQLFEETKRTIEKERDWLLTEGCLGSNEALRPKSEDNTEHVQGTFRKLQID